MDPRPEDIHDAPEPLSPRLYRWTEPAVSTPFAPGDALATRPDLSDPKNIPASPAQVKDVWAIDPSYFDVQDDPPDGHERDDTEADGDAGSLSTSWHTIIEWVAVVAAALAIALFIKAYLVQAFEIPSGSMQTTLNIGDRILVNKLSYDLGEVERGQLAVFSKLEGTDSDTEELIKRVIALPGETLEVRADGMLWIWGPGETDLQAVQIDESYLDEQNRLLAPPSISDSVDQNIWHSSCTNLEGDGSRCTLDGSSFYGMGDNRNASTDSRSFGPIPEENLVGRAFARIWPPSEVGGL